MHIIRFQWLTLPRSLAAVCDATGTTRPDENISGLCWKLDTQLAIPCLNHCISTRKLSTTSASFGKLTFISWSLRADFDAASWNDQITSPIKISFTSKLWEIVLRNEKILFKKSELTSINEKTSEQFGLRVGPHNGKSKVDESLLSIDKGIYNVYIVFRTVVLYSTT